MDASTEKQFTASRLDRTIQTFAGAHAHVIVVILTDTKLAHKIGIQTSEL